VKKSKKLFQNIQTTYSDVDATGGSGPTIARHSTIKVDNVVNVTVSLGRRRNVKDDVNVTVSENKTQKRAKSKNV